MKNMFNRFLAAALLLYLVLTMVAPVAAEAATTNSTGKRYNIMMVIDGSGSLTSKNAGNTDPKGMRYALVGELMGLLEDDGHNIGAIVFSGTQSKSPNPTDADMNRGIMLNTGLMSVDSPAPDGRTVKDYLESEIRRVNVDTSANGCTDIGTALKLAQEQLEQLKAKNNLESIVFLFTDGNTAFYGNPAGVVKKSIENRDNATLQMSQNGIRLFGAFLNNGGHLDDTEMKRLVCAANGISTTSTEFQHSYVEIKNSSSIHEASTSFLKFLHYIGSDEDFVIGVDSIHDSFTIPGIGVEEMNIRLFAPYGDDLPKLDVKITQPDGTVITGVSMKESRTFRVYKLINPDPGTWLIDIVVPEGNTLAYAYMPVVSLYIDAELQSNPAIQDIHVNMTPDFTSLLSQSGTIVTNPAAYMGYDCELLIKNVSNGETQRYDVLANTSGSLVCSPLLDTYGTFEARTLFSCGKINVESAPIVLDLTNRTPSAQHIPDQKLTYGLFQPKNTELDLSLYFSDPEDGTNLTYSVDSATTCNTGAISVNGGIMTLNHKGIGNGTVTVSAADSQGAYVSKIILVNTANVTIWYIIGLVILLIIIAIIVIASIKKKNNNRPDGELSVSFDMLHEGRACHVSLDLNVPGVDTTSKTTLYKLLQNALRDDNRKIQNGIYARDVMGFLMPFSTDLGRIAVCAAVKKKGKQNYGAISIKQGSKTTVLYNSYADFFLGDSSFTLEFKANDDNNSANPFDDNNPFKSTGNMKKDNFFDDEDDIFSAPVSGKPRTASSRPTKKDDFGSDSDMDFF